MFLWLRQGGDLSVISLAVVTHYFCPLVASKDKSRACKLKCFSLRARRGCSCLYGGNLLLCPVGRLLDL